MHARFVVSEQHASSMVEERRARRCQRLQMNASPEAARPNEDEDTDSARRWLRCAPRSPAHVEACAKNKR